MDTDLQWALGALLTVAVAIVGLSAGIFWKIQARIDVVERKAAEGDKELHGRVNRVRETMVHKQELDNHIQHLRSEMQEMRAEQREANRYTAERLDKLLDVIINTPKS